VLKTLHALEDTRKPGYYRKRARSEYGNFVETQPSSANAQSALDNNSAAEQPSPVLKKPRSASTKITDKIGVHVSHIESISLGLRDLL